MSPLAITLCIEYWQPMNKPPLFQWLSYKVQHFPSFFSLWTLSRSSHSRRISSFCVIMWIKCCSRATGSAESYTMETIRGYFIMCFCYSPTSVESLLNFIKNQVCTHGSASQLSIKLHWNQQRSIFTWRKKKVSLEDQWSISDSDSDFSKQLLWCKCFVPTAQLWVQMINNFTDISSSFFSSF